MYGHFIIKSPHMNMIFREPYNEYGTYVQLYSYPTIHFSELTIYDSKNNSISCLLANNAKKKTAPSLTLSKRINRKTRCQRLILCPAPTTTSAIMFFSLGRNHNQRVGISSKGSERCRSAGLMYKNR
jgi:hypothetical protein